jgi:hypothetical protein
VQAVERIGPQLHASRLADGEAAEDGQRLGPAIIGAPEGLSGNVETAEALGQALRQVAVRGQLLEGDKVGVHLSEGVEDEV